MKQEQENVQKRLKILGNDEIEAIYGKPHFVDEERAEYFSVSPAESAMMEQIHYIKARIYYILQLGYFKARHLFFVFTFLEVEEDVNYIKTRYFPDFQVTDIEITKVTRLTQRQLILDLYSYRTCGVRERQSLETQAHALAKVSSKPVYIFRKLLDYLAEQRIVIPGYTSMQDIVGNALTYEQNRLRTVVSKQLQKNDIVALQALLVTIQA